MDKKKIALLSLGAVVLGVSGYFAYRGIRKVIQNLKDSRNDGSNNESGDKPASVLGSVIGGGASTNPFNSKAELLAFQQWVINTKGDKTILGSGGASGFGDDGLWGSKSKKAWDKYGAEYKSSQSGVTPSGTVSSGTWSSANFSAQKELQDRIEDFGWDTEDNPSSNSFEWDVAGGWKFPTSYMKFYVSDGKDAVMTIEKQKNYSTGRYAKISGTWKKTSSGWEFNIGSKKYVAPYSGGGLSDKLWGILKDNGFYSKTDGSFLPFDEKPKAMKKRNRTQLDMGCEDLM